MLHIMKKYCKKLWGLLWTVQPEDKRQFVRLTVCPTLIKQPKIFLFNSLNGENQ